MKKKLSLITILSIVVGLLVAFSIQHYVLPNLDAPSIDSQLMSFASEINKNCPFMVDSETRLDNTVAGNGKSIIYNYTLVNYSKEQVNLNLLNSNLKPKILNVIKTNPDMQYLRDNDISFEYYYKDKFGVYIISFKFGPMDYKS